MFAVFLTVLFAFSGSAKEITPKFKAIAVKTFTVARGAEAGPEFPDLLLPKLKAELKKSGVYERVVGSDEALDPADAPKSLALEGRLLEKINGTFWDGALWGAGSERLKVHIVVRRLGDNEVVMEENVEVGLPEGWISSEVAEDLAKHIARDLKKKLAK